MFSAANPTCSSQSNLRKADVRLVEGKPGQTLRSLPSCFFRLNRKQLMSRNNSLWLTRLTKYIANSKFSTKN